MLRHLAPVLLAGLLSVPSVFAAPGIFWTDESTDTIYRANLDGTGVEILVPPPDSENPGALALDAVAGKVYWATFELAGFTPKIKRANLDGSGVETVTTVGSKSRPGGLAVDRPAGKIYFTDPSDCIPDCGVIWRMDLSGANQEYLRSGSLPGAIAVDPGSDSMWWSSEWDGTIYRSNLNGTTAQPVTSSPGQGIVLDPDGGKLYWTDGDALKIRRADYDGSNAEELVTTGLLSPAGIGLDLGAGKMYWADRETGKIQRANLDGSGVEDVISGLPDPRGLGLIPSGGDDEDEDEDDEDGGGDLRPTPRARHTASGQSKAKSVVVPAPR